MLETTRALFPPDPEKALDNESLLTTLTNGGPSLPTLVFTDLSGNYDAFLYGLKKRGFVTEKQNGELQVTELARKSRIILVGDTNDRCTKFPETMTLIALLRKQGVDVITTLGNHELFLLSFLVHPLIERVNVKPFDLKPNGIGVPIEELELTEFERTFNKLKNWLYNNGGAETVRSLASWCRLKALGAETTSDVKGHNWNNVNFLVNREKGGFNKHIR